MNHFELFDLPVSFAIDAAQLQARYRTLQQTLHPDRFANASERDKRLALQRTSQLNDAYQTLRQPLSRAEYLLELRGLSLQHEQQTLQDPEFLMAQMEWRERLEEIDSLAELDAALADLQQQTQAYQQELEQQLEAEQNEAAADTIRKLKFMHKLAAELELIEDKLNG